VANLSAAFNLTVAYKFIKREFKQVRLVATIKKEPDLNQFAVFEK
jgi:hypothetical protein